jgi:hypothetical protein
MPIIIDDDDSVIEDYEVKLTDPYWIKRYEELVAAHVAKSVAYEAMLKCQIDDGLKNAYG